MKVYHDKDGKIYYYDKDNNVIWLCEVAIHEGDNVVEHINLLFEEYNKDIIRKVKTLRSRLINNDAILLAEDEHEIIKYIDRHILS